MWNGFGHPRGRQRRQDRAFRSSRLQLGTRQGHAVPKIPAAARSQPALPPLGHGLASWKKHEPKGLKAISLVWHGARTNPSHLPPRCTDVPVPLPAIWGLARAFAGLGVRMERSAKLITAPLCLWTPTNNTQGRSERVLIDVVQHRGKYELAVLDG